MPLSYMQQSNPVKEYKRLTPTVDKPARRIQGLVEPVGPSPGCLNSPTGLPGQTSSQKTLSKQGSSFKTLEPTLPRFGPCYGEDTPAIKAVKEEAWQQVQKQYHDEEPSSVSALYLSAIKKVEKEARDSYDREIVKQLKKSEFREKMKMDGCFFLQLVLYILGGSDHLGYPEKHVYFGKTQNENDIRKWIKAMFFVGNQIPCVILNELMKQSFFQTVIDKGMWNPPSDLPQLTLYLVVVQPALDRKSGGTPGLISFPSFNGQKAIPSLKEAPSDLLHGLHTLVVGTGNDPLDNLDDDDPDMDMDLESGLDELERKNKFPSASEIKQLGIRLRKADAAGIRKIHFTKKFLLLGYLYVPPFTFDADTELMLKHLKNYETNQQQGKGKREVTAYLRFMRDLMQSQKDVTILESRGIVRVKREDHKDKLPGMLSRMVTSEEGSFTQNLRLTRMKVSEYRSPPCYLISWALIFTLVQTVFTILQYFEPRN